MNAHLNGDNGNSTSDDNKPASEDEISDRLLHVPRSSLPYIISEYRNDAKGLCQLCKEAIERAT